MRPRAFAIAQTERAFMIGCMRWPVFFTLPVLFAMPLPGTPVGLIEVAPGPESGFHAPYFLWVPAALGEDEQKPVAQILIIPNNTGTPSDDPQVHEAAVRGMLEARYRPIAEELGVILLCPVFPRPASHSQIYTHALDRDTFTTDQPSLRRLDLQLLAMLDDAIERLRVRGQAVDERALLLGFSASGMFVNRFTVLHPERVRAAAIGSPGGWPIAPVPEWEGRPLPYPVGMEDVEGLAGYPVDFKALRAVRLFFFLGSDDANDSVPFEDSYDPPERELVFTLFGQTPVDRWNDARRLHEVAELQATFTLYPGAGHEMTRDMIADVLVFLRAAMANNGPSKTGGSTP